MSEVPITPEDKARMRAEALSRPRPLRKKLTALLKDVAEGLRAEGKHVLAGEIESYSVGYDPRRDERLANLIVGAITGDRR